MNGENIVVKQTVVSGVAFLFGKEILYLADNQEPRSRLSIGVTGMGTRQIQSALPQVVSLVQPLVMTIKACRTPHRNC